MNALQGRTKVNTDTQVRVSATFSPAELDRIDDWGFAQRIRDRSRVIRELVRIGMSRATDAQS